MVLFSGNGQSMWQLSLRESTKSGILHDLVAKYVDAARRVIKLKHVH